MVASVGGTETIADERAALIDILVLSQLLRCGFSASLTGQISTTERITVGTVRAQHLGRDKRKARN